MLKRGRLSNVENFHPFLGLVGSMADNATRRVQQSLHARRLISPAALESLSISLFEQLLELIHRPIILEINIARARNELVGETAKLKFSSFCDSLRTSKRQNDVFSTYPELRAHCERICDQWTGACLEFIDRWESDGAEVLTKFGLPTARIIQATMNAGESHNNGRRVIIIETENEHRIVYKPRDISSLERLQDFIELLNKEGLRPPLSTLRVVARPDYGWIEFAELAECESDEAAARFHMRLGALIAILYSLAGNDGHYENIVATGEYPHLIDSETLFQPGPAFSDNLSADELGWNFINNSVLATGLLPHPNEPGSDDLCAITSRPYSKTVLKTIVIRGDGTDSIRIEPTPHIIVGSHNSVTVNGTTAPVDVNSVVSGFKNAYQLLVSLRSQLIYDGNLARLFCDTKVRVLLRSTSLYVSILRDLQHPQTLRDTDLRAQVIESSLAYSYEHEVREAESLQLLRGDVPIFLALPSCSNTYQVSKAGNKILSGYDVAVARLESLSEENLHQQIWLIRAALAKHAQPSNQYLAFDSKHLDCEPMDIAKHIGDYLLRHRIAHGKRSNWLSSVRIDGELRISPIGTDLYDGMSGICLFLAYLHQETGEERYYETAKRIVHEIETRPSSSASIGAFDGISGLIYLYSHLSILWNAPGLRDRALILVDQVYDMAHSDSLFDVISGCAGAIPCLSSLASTQSSSKTADAMLACANRLILSAESGALRRTIRYTRGMSHGLAGVAYGLTEAGYVLGDQHCVDIALQLAADERREIEAGGWTDPLDTDHANQHTWCHGAPGIVISRLHMYELLRKPELKKDARNALSACIPSMPNTDDCLCHGYAGNLDALLIASEIFGSNWSGEYLNYKYMLISRIKERGIRSSLEPMNPGLMSGIAGIGHQMLRLHSPHTVPSPLMLQKPKLEASS